MRVNHAPQRDRERGVSIALFGVFLVALLGSAAFTIDLGHAWQKRRQLITSTDAAALAAAQEYAEGGVGCGAMAADYIAQNFSNATLTACSLVGDGDDGFVTVEAEGYVDYIFGPAIGLDGLDAVSSTSAKWEAPGIVSGGLRPFGVCSQFLDELSPPPVPGNGMQYVIEYGRDDQSNVCGTDVPGNWSVLDFNGGSNPQGDINQWVEEGYDGEVCIGCWYEGNPGSFSNAMRAEMRHLRDNVDCFGLPIYDVANDLGGGNAEFHIVNFAGMKLIDFKLTGPQDDRFFTVEFVDCVIQGDGGGPGGFGAKVIEICAVDATDQSNC